MPKPFRRLTRAQIVRALTRLGELCTGAAIKAEIAIYGGTVMMIAYNCRQATKDVDAIFHPVGAMEPLIRQVAAELELPTDWMNSGVKTFVGQREARVGFRQLQIPGLVIIPAQEVEMRTEIVSLKPTAISGLFEIPSDYKAVEFPMNPRRMLAFISLPPLGEPPR
jgi:hypothetical protein